jgi:hypothetical protein
MCEQCGSEIPDEWAGEDIGWLPGLYCLNCDEEENRE